MKKKGISFQEKVYELITKELNEASKKEKNGGVRAVIKRHKAIIHDVHEALEDATTQMLFSVYYSLTTK